LLLQILWAGIFCLLDAALLQCMLAGDEAGRGAVLAYFKDNVLPARLHHIVSLLPHYGTHIVLGSLLMLVM
jgi:hypothetical protein